MLETAVFLLYRVEGVKLADRPMIISLEVFDEDVRNLHFNHNIVVMCGE